MNNNNNEMINIMKGNNKNINNNKKVAILHKILFCSTTALCLLLINTTVIFAQAKDAIPHGLWNVSQVVVEKKTNGKMKKNIYNVASEVQGFLPCPQAFEIKDSKTILLRYPGDMVETIEYTLEDGQLIVNSFGAILKYRYIINDDTLTLTITHKYTWNKPEGATAEIEEMRVITLNKQN